MKNIQNKKAVNGLAYVNANTNTYSPYGNTYSPYGNDLTGLNTSLNLGSSILLGGTNTYSPYGNDSDESQNVSSGSGSEGGWGSSMWNKVKGAFSNDNELTQDQKQARNENALGFVQAGFNILDMFKNPKEGQSTYNPDKYKKDENIAGLSPVLVIGIGALAVVGIAVLIIKKSGSKG